MASKKKTLLKPKRTKHMTLLTEEKAKEVRRMIIEGKTRRDIAKALNVTESTFYGWIYDNVTGFADLVEKADMERELKVAQDFSARLMEKAETEEGRENTRLLAIKQKEAEFLRQNLLNAKRIYDNRSIQNTVIVLPKPILGDLLEAEADNSQTSLDNKGES